MKKLQLIITSAIILLVVLAIILMNGSKSPFSIENTENTESSESSESTEQVNSDYNLKLSDEEVNKYFNTLVEIIVDSESYADVENRDTSLISNELMEDLKVLNSDEYKKETSFDQDTDKKVIEANEDGLYPVVDRYGHIFRYGSKQDSDDSYRALNDRPEYELLGYMINGNRLRLKIFIPKFSVVQSYSLIIAEDGKIKSFEVL